MDPTFAACAVTGFSFEENDIQNRYVLVPAGEWTAKLNIAGASQPTLTLTDSKLLGERNNLQSQLKGVDYRIIQVANPFESVTSSTVFGNRAAIKLANMDAVFGLTRNIKTYVDIAGAPGSWSEYVQGIRHEPGGRFTRGFGISLSPKAVPGALDWDLKLFRDTSVNAFKFWGPHLKTENKTSYSQPITGDVTKEWRAFSEWVKGEMKGEGVDLAMADGGGEGLNQEHAWFPLIFYECLTAISSLRGGGSFVCKFYDTHQVYTQDLLFLLSLVFERTYKFKPVSSRPANNEVYIVCLNFTIDTNLVQQLVQFMSGLDQKVQAREGLNATPGSFTSWLRTMNDLHITSQISALRAILDPAFAISRQPKYHVKKALLLWGLGSDVPSDFKSTHVSNKLPPTVSRDKMSDLTQAYLKWLSTQKMITRITRVSARQGPKILERWLITGDTAKMISELIEDEMSRDEATALVAELEQIKRDTKVPVVERLEASCAGDTVRYGNFSLTLAPRISFLLSGDGGATCEAVTRMAMLYESMAPGGQQWSLPTAHFNMLYSDFGVRNEAFASPLNSRLMTLPGGRYFSLLEVDKQLGINSSQGDFFAASNSMTNYPGNWEINPPFIENVLQRAAEKVVGTLSGLETSVPQPEVPNMTIFFVGPEWSDSTYYNILHNSPYRRFEQTLVGGTYFYESMDGKQVPTRVKSFYFILSLRALSEEQQSKIGALMNSLTLPKSSPVLSLFNEPRIVVRERKGGIFIDAQIVANAVKGRILTHGELKGKRERMKVQIFIEHVVGDVLDDAEKNYLVVNQEFLWDWDVEAIRKSDVIPLYKTRYAESEIKSRLGIHTGKYIGFTTPPSTAGWAPAKDPKLVVHLAGTSMFKNTEAVMRAWSLVSSQTSQLTLFITRNERNVKLDDLKYWDSLNPEKNVSFMGLSRLERVDNMYLLRGRELPQETLDLFSATATYHLCPSATEGFGHIINQGRRDAAVVITTDAPPMNELIDAKSGVLVSPIADTKAVVTDRLSPGLKDRYPPEIATLPIFYVEPTKLATVILNTVALTDSTKTELGRAARVRYDSDTDFFLKAITNL